MFLLYLSISLIAIALLVILFGSLHPYNKLFGDIKTHLPQKNQRYVALTFDDGPNPHNTGEILDILREYEVKATFFLVGKKVEKFGETAKTISGDGHTIGNHGYSHTSIAFRSKSYIEDEIIKTEKAIENQTGVSTNLFRPPYGFRSPALFKIANIYGYRVIGWSIWAYDWTIEDPEEIVKRILTRVKSGEIILLHDGAGGRMEGDRSSTVKALPTIIEEIKERGLDFTGLSSINW